MLHKSFEVLETKADGETGTFEALVSVFNNVDHVGDRILPGAFTKTLESWQESGDPIPVILSHNWDDPMAHIGVADPKNVEQTSKGLVVKGQLDISDNEVARQVYRLMKRRSLKAFSFGYTVPEGGEVRNDGVNDVSQIDLVEVGPTLKGANPEAQLQAVKSALEQQTDPLESDSPPPAEDKLTAEDQRSDKQVEDAETEDPVSGKVQAQDPLYRRSMEVVLEVSSAGQSLRKPPQVTQEPKPEPRSEAELRKFFRDLTLETLMTGVESHDEE